MDKETAVSALLCVAGVINVLPLSGALSARRLEVLYGVAVGDPNLLILLRHRAVLFGMLGGLMIASAFVLRLQPLALGAGFISMASFAIIAVTSRDRGSMNKALQRVLRVDWVGLALIIIAASMAMM